jgi:hypothetical protein
MGGVARGWLVIIARKFCVVPVNSGSERDEGGVRTRRGNAVDVRIGMGRYGR